jgi:alkanesulfonate monooxygenase SsuD/methylene tetrahydromethanopterin reductase-like flavin-dependent oxidoreductase (luciferase family)
MLGLPFGTAGGRADRLEEALPVIRSLWTEPRTTFTGKHYQLVDAVAEPKPTQRPHPPIWIGGSGRRRTLRMAAEHASVWNAASGTPEQVSELSAVLDRHCADIGRDPSEIRRSVQIRVPDSLDGLQEQVRGFVAVGVTEFILDLEITAGGVPGRRAPTTPLQLGNSADRGRTRRRYLVVWHGR